MIVLPEKELPLRSSFKTYVVVDVISVWYVNKITTISQKMSQTTWWSKYKIKIVKM